MSKSILILLTVALCVIFAATAMSSTVSIKLSGAGKVNDSTIKAGQKVSLDIYFDNEVPRMGLSLGFRIFSPDKSITTILHPADSGNGIEDSKGGVRGDIKGYNGFEDKAIFNLLNKAVITNWDGKLPDTMGIMTMVFGKIWKPQPVQKCYSIDIIVPTAGLIAVDSSFFPPGGRWMMVTEANKPEHFPTWKGPYKYKVVK